MHLKHSVCFAALLLMPLACPAQIFQPKAIRFNGAPEYTSSELMNAAGFKAGAMLTTTQMNEHAKKLMDSGAFDTLSYKFDGLDIVFTLIPATLYPVYVDNLPITGGTDIDSLLRKNVPLYHGKVPSQGTMTDQVASELHALLKSEGIDAPVTFTPKADADKPGAVGAMAFQIASPPVSLGQVRYIGVSMEVSPKLRAIVSAEAMQPFDTTHSASNLQQQFLSTYRDLGFAEATVDVVEDGKPVVAPDAIHVPFVVKVNEGRTYKLGTVVLPAGSLLHQDEVERALADPRAAAKGMQLIAMLLTARYKSKGYLDFTFTQKAQIDEAAGAVNYTIELSPGPVYHLGLLRFDNVSDQLRTMLMRQWQILPGDPFNLTYLDTFLPNAAKSDPQLRATLANITAKYDIRADPTSHEVNLIIRLEKP